MVSGERVRILIGTVLVFMASGCLERSLPVTPVRAIEEPEIHTSAGAPLEKNEERKTYLEQLSDSITKSSAEDTSLEELVRLLREMNEHPEQNALSMAELRALQEVLLHSGPQLARALAPGAGATSPTDAASHAAAFDISAPRECPSRTWEAKVLPSGLRIISSLPRKDACSLKLSKIFQDALNRILAEKHVVFLYEGRRYEARRLEEFFAILAKLGFRTRVSYRTYLAPFVRLYKPEGDPYLEDSEIPMPLWLRTGIEVLQTGRPAVIPAPHSEVFFEVKGKGASPEAQFKIYFSDKGFVFDDEDLVLPHWSGLRTLQMIPRKELPRLLTQIHELHEAFEIFKSQAPQDLPLGGFGLLGVCNDGAALLMRGFAGPDFVLPFPLVRSDKVKMPADYPFREVWENTPSDTMIATPRDLMVQRIFQSNPFEGGMNPFLVHQKILDHLKEETLP